MNCPVIVLDSYYIVSTFWGRIVCLPVFAVLCWNLYSFLRPARLARRFGVDRLDPPGLALVRSLIARNIAIACAALFLLMSVTIKPAFAVLCVACFSSLVDAVAVARARGIVRSLDLWVLAVILAVWAVWLDYLANELCLAMMNEL